MDEFSYQGRDGVAIFWVAFLVFFPGVLGFPFISVDIFVVSFGIFLVLVLGLDCKISVAPGHVQFKRRLFWIPYYVRSGAAITGVSYDSDWDEERTASGVVVEIDGKEIHIGSHSRKTVLYNGLWRTTADFEQCNMSSR